MPDLRINLIEGTMDLLLGMLGQGDLDIVIGRTVDESDSLSEFNTEVLYTEPVDLVVRCDHPLIRLPEISWDDVQSYRWIVWPRGSPIRRALEVALAAVGRSLPPNHIESNSVIANITLLNNSDVIRAASRRSARTLSSMNMLRILPLELRGFGSVSMYWHHDELHPKFVEQALDCIRCVIKAAEDCS